METPKNEAAKSLKTRLSELGDRLGAAKRASTSREMFLEREKACDTLMDAMHALEAQAEYLALQREESDRIQLLIDAVGGFPRQDPRLRVEKVCRRLTLLTSAFERLVQRIEAGHPQSIGSIHNVRMVQFGVDEIQSYCALLTEKPETT